VTKKRVLTVVIVALIPVLIGVSLAVYDVWRSTEFYVISRDAQVMVPTVTVSAPVAGQVTRLVVDVGDTVQPGDLIASLSTIPGAGTAAAATGSSRFLVNLRAPAAGTVLSTVGGMGASVTAGQTVATIGDLEQAWIVANVEESRIARVQPGQTAGVKIQALDATITGRVAQIAPPTTGGTGAQASAGARQTGTSASARTNPTIPVQIALDPPSSEEGDGATNGQRVFYPGMTAEVRINTR
jgi:multidrug resistance efflux pump